MTVIVDGWWIDGRMLVEWPTHILLSSTLPPANKIIVYLSVIVGRLSTNKADGYGGGGQCHTTDACLVTVDCCPP